MSKSKVSFSTMRSIVFFGLITLLTIAMLYLVLPFIYPLFWAAIIGILFYPVYHKLYLWFHKHDSLASLTTLVMVLVIIFLPLTILSVLLVNESLELYTSVSQTGIFSNVEGTVEGASSFFEKTSLAPYLDSVKTEWTTYASEATRKLSGSLFTAIKSVSQNSLRFMFMFFIMFYALYYFFKDGPTILKRIQHLSPLGDQYEEMLFEKFKSTIRATMKSTFIVGGVQGFIGGIMFWITGIEGALLWGVIMGALSVIPAIGSFIVWLPAGIIMLAFGQIWQGLTILLVGALIISTIDNFLRPPLVGKDIQMHPMIVLLSTLGGIALFGISGFVIGPIIAALYISMVSIYDHYYKNELKHN